MDDNYKVRFLLAWRGRIYEILISKEDYRVVFSSSAWVLSGRSFVTVEDGKGDQRSSFVQCKKCQNIEILTKNVVRNKRSGLCFPYILCRFYCQESVDLCLLQIRDTDVKLSGHISWNLKEVSEVGHTPSKNFTIIDGPHVICLRQGNIYFINFWALMKSERLQKVPLPDLNIDQNLLRKQGTEFMKLVGLVQLKSTSSKEQYLLLVAVRREMCFGADPASQECFMLPSQYKTCAYIITTYDTQETPCLLVESETSCAFIPDIYSDLIQKIIFNKLEKSSDLEESCHQGENEEVVSKGRMYDSEISVVTSMQQLVVFENGRVKKCKPLSNPTREFVMFENNVGHEFYTLLDTDGKVSVLDSTDLTVKDCYPRVCELMVADFTKSGGDQLLLVNDRESETSVPSWKQFILTDCFSFKLTPQNIKERNDETEESVQAAVRALENRLQSGINHLAAVRCELGSKMRLLRQVTSSLISDKADSEKSNPTQGLVQLLGEVSLEERHNLGAGDAPLSTKDTMDQPLIIYNQWQRIYENNWVVGMNLRNTSKRKVENISASLVSPSSAYDLSSKCQMFAFHRWTDGDLQYTAVSDPPKSKVPRLATPQTHTNIPRKVHRLDPEQVAELVVSSSVPCFSKEYSITPILVLSWRGSQMSQNNAKIKKDARRMEDEYGGKRGVFTSTLNGLRAADLLNGKLLLDLGNIAPGDFSSHLVLEMTQEKLSLAVVTLYHTVHLSQLLSDQSGFTWSESLHCWLHDSSGPLKHMRVYTERQEHRRSSFILYYRDDVQLSLFLHSLYNQLPDDAVIVTGEEKREGAAVAEALKSILYETQLALDINHESSDVVNIEEPLGVTNTKTTEGLHALRDQFAKRQKQLWSKNVKELNHSDNTDSVEGLRSLAIARETTDYTMDHVVNVVRDNNLH